MNNNELAAKCLIEAAELLTEYANNGIKGITAINVAKNDVDALAAEREDYNDNIISRQLLKMADKNAEKALEKGNPKTFENIGKRIRALQSSYSKRADKSVPSSFKDDNYMTLKDGLLDKTPIKDKEKMRKNNIKLGYQIAKAHSDAAKKSKNESVDLDSLLTNSIELLNENAKWRKTIKGKGGMSLKNLGKEAALYKSNKNNIFNDDKDVNDMVSKFGDIYIKEGKSARNNYQINEKEKEIEKIKDNMSFIKACKEKKANGSLSQSDINRLKDIKKKTMSDSINRKINNRVKSQNESVDLECLLIEAVSVLIETPDYNDEKSGSCMKLYDGNTFIGTYQSSTERRELIKEYEDDLKEKENK